ncbi:MAG: BamA/TamA family outer membrane protein [candidate division Zixibacteria bacterium]
MARSSKILSVLLLLLVWFAVDVTALDRATLRWIRKRPVINAIIVEGNSHFSQGDITSRMYSQRRTMWRALKGDRRSHLQRETLGRDTMEVKFLYLTNGFLGVKIEESFKVILPDSSAMVHVQIVEGRQFRYDTTTVTGDMDDKTSEFFYKSAKDLKKSEPVDPFSIRALSFKLKRFLANRGYPYAEIAYTLDTSASDGRTVISFACRTDSLVHFGDVTIEGLQNYPDYVARRELKLKPGEEYRREDILESQRRLFESGYFSTLHLDNVPDPQERLRPDFRLRLRERKTRFFNTELGVVGQSNLRDLVWQTSMAVGKRNLFGSRRAELSVSYFYSLGDDARVLENLYRARFTEPWVLGMRVPLSISAEWEPRLRDPDQLYKRRSYSVSAEMLFRFGRQVRLTAGIEYESLKLTEVPVDQAAAGVDVTSSGRRGVFGDFIMDKRDNLFIPSRGVFLSTSAEIFGGVLGGDANFYRVQSAWSIYQKVWPGWISATRFMGGIARPFGKSDSLITDDRLLTGGANSVRSFRENHLGPLDELGTPTGASYTFVFNQEFRWRTIQIFNKIPLLSSLFKSFPLWQSLFVDVGNGFSDRRSIRLDAMAVAYGAGVQIVSPAGPIRIDYAQRIRTKRFEFADRWHFTILYAF